jgi:hypothetical protein
MLDLNDIQKNEDNSLAEPLRLAEVIRTACIQAALAGYEDASLSGLCHEGAWERAIDAIRELKLETLIQLTGKEETINTWAEDPEL